MSAALSVVTGGAGFIGSHMVDLLLERGHSVRVIDNLAGGREANLAQHTESRGCRSTAGIFERCAPTTRCLTVSSTCFISPASATSCPPSNGRSTTWTSMSRARCCVLECARSAKVKKSVYAASSSCYGLADVPTREDHPIAPEHPYALSKYQGEMAALHWRQVYGLPVNSIRIFNAYGPRVRTTGAYGAVFGVFFKQKLAGKPFTVIGDGPRGAIPSTSPTSPMPFARGRGRPNR